MIYFPRDQSHPSINNTTQNTTFSFLKSIIIVSIQIYDLCQPKLKKKFIHRPSHISKSNLFFSCILCQLSSWYIYEFLLVVLTVWTCILKYQEPKIFIRGSLNFNNCLQIIFFMFAHCFISNLCFFFIRSTKSIQPGFKEIWGRCFQITYNRKCYYFYILYQDSWKQTHAWHLFKISRHLSDWGTAPR